MSDAIKKDRSPNYPKATLADAIESVKRLYSKAGKAQIRPEVAAGALGYSGMNGAALTALGVLNSYGLIDRTKKDGISVSNLAIKLIHPLNPSQELESKRESALRPRVFNELYTGGFHQCSEDVLCNHLIQNEFTPDGARKAAFVYKANSEFANLSGESITSDDESKIDSLEVSKSLPLPQFILPSAITTSASKNESDSILRSLASLGSNSASRVLARYSVPLGSNEATIIFTGEILSPEDFDALGEYVKLFKKQFERTAMSVKGPTPIPDK